MMQLRIWMGAALLLDAGVWVPAQTPPAGLQSCVRIADDAARLACFDREMAAASAVRPSRKDTPALTAAPLANPSQPANPSPPVTLSPQQKFGLAGDQIQPLEPGPMTAPPKLKELQAHIAKVSRRSDGHALYELDNGQVWLQMETRSEFFVRSGDGVTITTGALGSYWLATDSHNATRVKRVL
jgi:hypothetical protein